MLFPGKKAGKDKGGLESGRSDLLCEDGYGKAICCSTGNWRCWSWGIWSRRRLAWNSFIVKTPGNDSQSWRTNSRGLVQERVGGGTAAFGRILQEHYFPMSRRVSTELHWYISHVWEARDDGWELQGKKIKQHWQLKLGLKQIKKIKEVYTTHPKAIFFPSLGCTNLISWEVRALLLPSHQGQAQKSPQHNLFSAKHFAQEAPRDKETKQLLTRNVFTLLTKNSLTDLATPLTVQLSSKCTCLDKISFFCECWERRIKDFFPLSFPSSPIQRWIP